MFFSVFFFLGFYMFFSTSVAGKVTLVPGVPGADVGTVGVGVVTGVRGVRGQTFTQPAALQTVGSPLVAVGGSELLAVAEGVVAGDGGGGSQSRAHPAALAAVLGNAGLVAAGLRQGGTVGPFVLTRCPGGEGGVSGARHWAAGEGDHGAAHPTHPHTSPQSDVPLLSPA